MTDSEHITRCMLAGAVSVGLIVFCGFSKRSSGSKRWVFSVVAIVGLGIVGYIGWSELNLRGVTIDDLAWLGISVSLLLTAMVFLVMGFRKKRVGDHPYCRRCGFDLFGKPPESNRCSECGVELTGKAAPVIGVRRYRSRMLLAGLGLFLLFGLFSGKEIYQAVNRIDFNRYKPISWLYEETRSGNNRAAERAFLTRTAELSDSEARSLVKLMLKNAEAGRPGRFGAMMIPIINHHDCFDEPTLRRVLLQIPKFRWPQMPVNIVRGKPLPVLFWGVDPSDYSMARLNWTTRVIEDRLGDVVIPPGRSFKRTYPGLNEDLATVEYVDLKELWPQFPAGRVRFSRTLEYTITLQRGDKTITEVVNRTTSGWTNLIEPEQMILPKVAPTASEATSWTVNLNSRGSHMGIWRGKAAGRIYGHLFLTDQAGRRELGMFEIRPADWGNNWNFKPGEFPKIPFVLEIIPADAPDEISYDLTPILDQKIVLPVNENGGPIEVPIAPTPKPSTLQSPSTD